VGNDDKRISLGKKETGARAALPIWLEFMQGATRGTPVEDFQNVVPLEKLAGAKQILVDTPDTAPPADAAEQGLGQGAAPASPGVKPIPKTPTPPPTPKPTPTPGSPTKTTPASPSQSPR
jgi:penicillin-binding protein 1A